MTACCGAHFAIWRRRKSAKADLELNNKLYPTFLLTFC